MKFSYQIFIFFFIKIHLANQIAILRYAHTQKVSTIFLIDTFNKYIFIHYFTIFHF